MTLKTPSSIQHDCHAMMRSAGTDPYREDLRQADQAEDRRVARFFHQAASDDAHRGECVDTPQSRRPQ